MPRKNFPNKLKEFTKMFNRTRRMTVSLSFIALFFLLTILLASATLVSKDRPTLLEFASDAHCFRRPKSCWASLRLLRSYQ